MVLGKWTTVFIINACALGSAGIISIFFLVESPRYLLHRDIDKFVDCLRRVAKYNGTYEVFEKQINESEYVEIIQFFREHLKKERGNVELSEPVTNTKGATLQKKDKESSEGKGDLIPPDSPAGIGNSQNLYFDDKNRRKSTNDEEGIKIDYDNSVNAMRNDKELSALNTITKYNQKQKQFKL